ncbi:granulocyte colony-stimulating factor receptor [Rhinichthys klamathensis goyatoka]|uniref:granulocyte colony-stimulating factor receptor n=1 Tax=Rhinichthys klamathensis goyatoka TaxID=3034132 RepID=UPI0024B6225A|nr:granulocyte colony-stimulating factor receptor [Rhinichthys klamathensis goyatoka]
MASVWLVLVLGIYINAWIKVIQASCATVHTPATVVLAGSPVSVSCSIEDDCLLTKGKDFRVAWKINKDFAPSNLSYQENNRTYGLRIPSLPHTADIACFVCVSEENCQIVDGVKVKVDYPPPIPRNLSCVLNVTESSRLLCQWDPGEETASLSTKYTLHALRAQSEKAQYEIPPGQHFYLIPRDSYSKYSELEVYVTAVNVLGNATSASLELIPMDTAKFNAPEIKSVEADAPGCLQYSWSLPQSWVQSTLIVELRLTTLNNQLDKELFSTFSQRQGNEIKKCGLLHGTHYSSTMRVKYRPSSEWSEWSDPKTTNTLMRAPAGSLDTWLKVNDQVAKLYWKPSKDFRANGWDLSYTVESKETKTTLCVTQESHCSFNLNKWIKKVYLRATNAMGSSNHTQVPVYRKKGLDSVSNVSVRPQSQTSVLIAWESPESSGVTGYTLEWRSLSETPAVPLSFILMDKNSSSTLVTGLRPYKPYEISVFPKYADGVGRPLTVMAYSSERAPSEAPNLEVVEIHHSQVKLHWDEIPLEQRNGIIQGYTIYFWDDSNDTQVIHTEKTNVVVENLQPLTKYHALVSVLTMGGSLNGSVENLTTGHIDGFDMVLFVIPACIGLSLLIIIVVFTCLGKHERVKMCLWPIIPDPANSSIKRWTTTDSLQGMPPFKEDKDPVLVFLSRFSLLDLSEKEPFKGDYVKESQWSHDMDSRDGSHSSFQACSYDSEQDRDSVPYATVVFGGSYQSHSTPLPPYVRSESTQPLLGGDEPASPPPYENVSRGSRVSKAKHFTAFPSKSTGSEENEELWEEFPMLRSLEIRDTDHN